LLRSEKGGKKDIRLRESHSREHLLQKTKIKKNKKGYRITKKKKTNKKKKKKKHQKHKTKRNTTKPNNKHRTELGL